jgi:hypothetical protein
MNNNYRLRLAAPVAATLMAVSVCSAQQDAGDIAVKQTNGQPPR